MGLAWFDTHAHVCDPKFDPDRDDVVDLALKTQVQGFIEIADGPSEWAKARKLADRHPQRIWWAAGLHPYFADQASPETWNNLKSLSKVPNFVAIGEVGLDYAKCPIPPEQQISAFEQALNLAQDLDKPLVIHCRDAYQDMLPILKAHFPRSPKTSPGVVHCFSGNQAQADQLIELGFYLGVDGPLTYPNSAALREVFGRIPLENVVIETDSPYLPPQSIRGQRNEPRHIAYIGMKLAEIRRLTPENLAKILQLNTEKLFRIKLTEN